LFVLLLRRLTSTLFPYTTLFRSFVLSLAASDPSLGLVMMISYILGFSIPFLILAFFIGHIKWVKKHSAKITKIGGYLMIIVGIALFFDWMTAFTAFLAKWTGFSGF